MWFLKDDRAVPPLPGEIPRTSNGVHKGGVTPLFKSGCWIVQMDPVFADDLDAELTPDLRLQGWAVCYRGTLRVERLKGSPPGLGERMRVSGDLYVKRQNWTD